MAKCSQHLGFTWTIGPNRQYCKVDIEVSEIDTDIPLDEQLKKVDGALDGVWKYILKRMDTEVEEVTKKFEST